MKRRLPNPTGALMTLWALVLVMAGTAGATSYSTGDDFTVRRSDLRQAGGDYVESIDMLFNVERTGGLILGTSLGSVNVRTWPYDKVRLVVDKRANVDSEIDARRIFDMFRIQARRGGADLEFTARARTSEAAENMGVTFTIWVPRSYNLDIKTKSGDIEIPELEGRFTAHTSDGKIVVDCEPEAVDIEVEDRTGGETQEDPVEAGASPKRDANSADGSDRH
jgi:hypothetical protein